MKKLKYPLVSIITPSYNQARFIEAAIQSVLAQDYSNIEYIIVDGGSTDGTQEILKRYDSQLRWLSEPDQGQADAINKGFQLAQGEILAWLNSDDLYESHAVSQVVAAFQQAPEVHLIYGNGYLIDTSGRKKKEFAPVQPFNLWKLIYWWDFILQPTAFFRRAVLDKIGFLDTSLKYCLDWDYWIRIGSQFKVKYIPKYLAYSREHRHTKTRVGGRERFREIVQVVRKYSHQRFPPSFFVYGTDSKLQFLNKSLLTRWLYKLMLGFMLRVFWPFVKDQSFYTDKWMRPHTVLLLPTECGNGLQVQGRLPNITKLFPLNINIYKNKQLLQSTVLTTSGDFSLDLQLPNHKKEDFFKLDFYADRWFIPSQYGNTIDRRKLVFLLKEIHFYDVETGVNRLKYFP
ncbi:MAG: glycosyltransferase family 2 protein [bacterium]